MGSNDRDYMKDEARRWAGGGGGGIRSMFSDVPITPVVKWIIIANIVVWLLQIFLLQPADPERYTDRLPEDPNQRAEMLELLPKESTVDKWFAHRTDKIVKQGQIWRLLTPAFLHDTHSPWHILFNLLVLFFFGRTVERMYGSREFLSFYLLAALVSGVFATLLDLWTGRNNWGVGASGAIAGVFALYVMHYPRSVIRLMGLVPVEARWLFLLYLVLDLHPVLLDLMGQPVGDGIGHAAHLGGTFLGWLYFKRGWRVQGMLPSLGSSGSTSSGGRKTTAGRKTPVKKKARKPSKKQLKVDEILDKVSDKGLHSLTDEERDFLEQASDELKG